MVSIKIEVPPKDWELIKLAQIHFEDDKKAPTIRRLIRLGLRQIKLEGE
jgi:hypothetical protein